MKKHIDPHELAAIMRDAKAVAIRYRELTGKPLGITAEVAEYEAARILGCTLCEARTPGHDLIDADQKRVQVKGRVLMNTKTQKVPRIEASTPAKPWDYVLLVLLDANYEPTAIYKAEQEALEQLFATPRPNGSMRNRGLSVRKFISLSSAPVWEAAK